MANVAITLIGLDRRTASLGLALKRYAAAPGARHTFTITGYDEDPFAVEAAEKLEAVDQVAKDPALALQNADLVYVAMPYHAVKTIFEVIGPVCKRGAVGASIIANSELIGDPRTTPDAASADLFDNATLALCAAPDCPPEAVALVSDLAALLGMKLRFMDAAEHDGAIAATEMLPLLLQLAVFESIQSSPGWSDLQHLTNAPFALATFRLGLEDPKDVAMLLNLNRDNNIRVLESVIAQAGEIITQLRTDEREILEDTFDHATKAYAMWEQARRGSKAAARNEPQMVAGPRLFGALPGLVRGRLNRKEDRK